MLRSMNCHYCGLQGTARIPAVPNLVCAQHATDFWTGLLAFAHDGSQPADYTVERPPTKCQTSEITATINKA